MSPAARARRDRLRAMLADLKMPGALEAVDGVLAQVDSGAVTASEAIELVLTAQIALRNNRRLQAAMRSSRLPAVKTLAQVDFTFQPSIKREQIESLHELGFLDRAENVILLGPPGVGKTHLAISLAIAAAEAGRRVYYGTLAGLIDSLMEARAAGELSRRQRVLTHPALRVVDEIGYLPVSQDGAVLFFQLINARHERASTVLTSNKGFEEWGHVLGDEIMAAALIDRLLHHCPIVNIRGTATGCGSISTGCGLRRNSSVRESQRDRRLRSFAARFGQDSGRSAPCVQPKTPDGHQRENVRSARDVSPRSVQFSVAIDTRYVTIRSGPSLKCFESGWGQVYNSQLNPVLSSFSTGLHTGLDDTCLSAGDQHAKRLDDGLLVCARTELLHDDLLSVHARMRMDEHDVVMQHLVHQCHIAGLVRLGPTGIRGQHSLLRRREPRRRECHDVAFFGVDRDCLRCGHDWCETQ